MKRTMAALVMGNAEYPDHELSNPLNDAEDVAAKLTSYGFDVTLITDAKYSKMDKAVKASRDSLDKVDVGLFFFAGHGMQIEGTNYLLALDTDMDGEDTDAKHSSLSLDKVVEVMGKSKAQTKIIILDACRKNPWERRWNRGPESRGLASIYAPKGTIIGFATSPGETAGDGIGRNGTYTDALLQHIKTPDCTIESMFKRVRNTVAAATNGKQTTWEHTSLSGEFYFNLSLGMVIEEYDETALADGLFIIDESHKSHKIIKGLRSHDYYRQNPAVELLTADSAARMIADNLFVIGRNIYQAACGGSNAAIAFVTNFASQTSGYAPTKRKAILDGMLFEIFFNSKAELRDSIKGGYFDELFDLERSPKFKPSFDFIAESLTAARGDFYALPGSGHDLAVTIATKSTKEGTVVKAVYIDGKDVLREEEDVWDTGKYSTLTHAKIKKMLSEQLVIPKRHLEIAYTPASAKDADEILFPRGWTLRKG